MRKRIVLALVVAVILAASVITYVVATIYWQRQVSVSFDVHGINAGLLPVDYNAYRNKQETTNLDSNGQAQITIFFENFYVIWLNTTFTTDAVGLTPILQGQYVAWTWTWIGNGWAGVMTPVSEPFDITGYHAMDKAHMMWTDPGINPSGPTGYALLVTVNPNSGEYPNPGHYSLTVTFQMGFE